VERELQVLYRRLRKASLAFVIILLIGTFGYRYLAENATLFDGLYMTFLTVTTIGFHEVIQLDGNVPGRIFTIAIAFSGIGILTYGFSNFAALIIESDLSRPIKRRQMERTARKMNQHYIICGGSHVGLEIADELERTRRPFVLIDRDESVIDEQIDNYRFGNGLIGDCTEEDTLRKAGIENCQGLFITTRNDHLNIVICVTARQLSPYLRIICHCKEPENEPKLRAVGANRVISPSRIGGLRMASEMIRPTVTTFLDEMLRDTHRSLRIEELLIPPRYHGKTTRDLPLSDTSRTLILAIRKGESWEYNPAPDFPLPENGYIIVMTTPEELKKLQKDINPD
jgi:voltage-gated potassium channel